MAIFSKQHYEAIAAALREDIQTSEAGYNLPQLRQAYSIVARDCVLALVDMFRRDNPKFNEKKFIDAVLKNNP